MKIIADDNIPYLKGRLEPLAEVIYTDQFGFNPELVKDADALLIRTRTRCNEALLSGSRVRLVATATIGTDQIDIPWCNSRGIRVASSPGCNAPAVAQYVWSALLRLGFRPSDGMRLGVVGNGNIGSIVTRWGRLMGAEVVICDPPKERAGIAEHYMPLQELMHSCDAVTFHTPLTFDGSDPTYHLAGEKELALLRPGSILINASRGPVVDNKSLSDRIGQGDIRVALDVWEGEPKPNRGLLSAVDYGTFHIAGYSRQGKERATRMILEAVEREFGVEIDKTGLTGVYLPENDGRISAEGIMASYDPMTDSAPLKMNPDAFDILRKNYNYREEYHGD